MICWGALPLWMLRQTLAIAFTCWTRRLTRFWCINSLVSRWPSSIGRSARAAGSSLGLNAETARLNYPYPDLKFAVNDFPCGF
jgi:hypothetical protein